MNTHIIRYAKHHYGHSNSKVEDLKILIGKWSGIPADTLTLRDVMECVYDVWLEVARSCDKNSLMRELFFTSHHRAWGEPIPLGVANAELAISVMLGAISVIPVQGLEFEDKFDIDFRESEVESHD